MSHFEVYAHPTRERLAIRRGFSPVAALLNWIWMFRHGLWLEGAAMLLVNGLGLFLLRMAAAPLGAVLARKTAHEWVHLLDAAGVPVAEAVHPIDGTGHSAQHRGLRPRCSQSRRPTDRQEACARRVAEG